MKKLAAILCLSALTTGAFAQGTINFANSPATLISANINGNTAAISGAAGSYYFGLLISPTGGAGTWAFGGVYGTNINNLTGGRFGGGTQQINGWAPGATMSYQVAGWDSSLGATFNPAWLVTAPSGLFGVSAVASGVAGGGAQSLPPLQPFGATGIQAGFVLTGPVVPEPTSMALAGLGAAALLIFRRRK